MMTSKNFVQAEKPGDPGPAHSPLGPSSSERWLQCPGSIRLTAGLPDTDSDYAEEGTAAHTLSEWCRKQDKRAKAFLGKPVPMKRSDGTVVEITVDQEMVDGVQAFIDYVNEFKADVEIIEERVSYTAWVDNGWGTLDDGRINEESAVCAVTDLKYGKGVKVFAKENTQLMSYALGIFQDYGHLYDIKEFWLRVFQPRLGHIDEWKISVVDLLKWANDVLKPGALLTQKPDAPLAAGTWCQFCKVKASCSTRAKWVADQTLGDFADLDAGPVLTQPELISNADLARIMLHIDQIKAWCKDIEARAMSEVQRGNPVGDFKLVAGRGSRSWRDEAEVAKALPRVRGLKRSLVFKRVLISPAQAEKLIGKTHPFMLAHVVKSQGAPTLVPGSDPRPALAVDATAEFADLDNEKESWE